MTTKLHLPILSLLVLATIAPYMLHAQPVKIILWDIWGVIIQKNKTTPETKGNALTTLDIVERLTDLGYKQYLGSNINEQSFKNLVTNTPLAPFFQRNFNLANSQIVSYDPDNPKIKIKKPDARFFQLFLAKSNITNPQDVIFIDNKIQNIQAAQRIGIQGIHFINAEQLAADLEQMLNIPLAAAKAMSY